MYMHMVQNTFLHPSFLPQLAQKEELDLMKNEIKDKPVMTTKEMILTKQYRCVDLTFSFNVYNLYSEYTLFLFGFVRTHF